MHFKYILGIILIILTLLISVDLRYTSGNISAQESFSLKQVNLVSSIEEVASVQDKNLTDAWGLEFGHTGRIWLNNSSGFSTVYDGSGNIVKTKDVLGQEVPLAVKVPVPSNTEEVAPLTGLVFSEDNAFKGDSFIFVTEQGTISGWHKNPDGFEPLTATMRVDNSTKGAVYKGASAAKADKGWILYAADFANNKVEMFDQNYQNISSDQSFKDPEIPEDFAPFNIKNIQNKLYVTYAKQGLDKQNDVSGVGNGYIDIYDTQGQLIKRFVSEGELNSPWGMALAPDNFGSLSQMLLVGNFGDGHINAYNMQTGEHVVTVKDDTDAPLQIDKLWSLTFGTNNGAGKSNELFFSAGPSAEDQGLFGKLELH